MSDEQQKVMPPKIAMALVKAAREADAVEKKGTVKTASYSYTFAGADALMSEAREALEKASLAIVLTRWWPTVERHDETDADGKPVVWYARTLFAVFLLVHEEGESFELGPFQMPVIEERGRGTDKCDAAALTYLTGYVMRGLLNLPRVEKGSQVDERDDSKRGGQRVVKEPTAEEKREKLLLTIRTSLGNVPGEEFGSLRTWIEQKHAKAVKGIQALGGDPERELDALIKAAAKRIGDDEGEVLAWIATATAKAKS